MPGIGELMEGAMQQAPQPERHSMNDAFMKTVKALILTAETTV
jgi:hypothetical protein